MDEEKKSVLTRKQVDGRVSELGDGHHVGGGVPP
jgi:hypothetical protein